MRDPDSDAWTNKLENEQSKDSERAAPKHPAADYQRVGHFRADGGPKSKANVFVEEDRYHHNLAIRVTQTIAGDGTDTPYIEATRVDELLAALGEARDFIKRMEAKRLLGEITGSVMDR